MVNLTTSVGNFYILTKNYPYFFVFRIIINTFLHIKYLKPQNPIDYYL